MAGVYVYGIVPADVDIDDEARGIGEAPIAIVRQDGIAALVSDLDLDRPLGTPEDLVAHGALLDATAAAVPVLPVRFGAVLTDRGAVAEELLAEHQDEFDEALHQLDGKAQYVISARYVPDTLLQEVVAGDPRIARLREAIRDRPEDAARTERIALGEAINGAIEARRQVDTRAVADAVAPVADDVVTHEPAGEYDAAYVSVLADLDREGDLERALGGLAERLQVRLLGPLAAYDFVGDVSWDSSVRS
ncbi:GvpL/GvpF family gas vesicle protein [Dactylosporangium sp. McL0621]|uniref:GvpL/GvpF family gas vesicle protein n=1 Tax=Dactylosporangium sp. McL0621 TaxID=3415678 RepID=UPI003CF8ED95